MSGRALDGMRRAMNATGVYKLDGSGSADWETDACAAGFDMLEDGLDGLLADAFAATASPECLDDWEKLYSWAPVKSDIKARRKVQHARLAMNSGRHTLGDLIEMLRAVGLEGHVKVSGTNLTVYNGKPLGTTDTRVRLELDSVLPAHLTWNWNNAVTWVAFDAYAGTFAAIDRLNLKWRQFDSMNRPTLAAQNMEQEE